MPISLEEILTLSLAIGMRGEGVVISTALYGDNCQYNKNVQALTPKPRRVSVPACVKAWSTVEANRLCGRGKTVPSITRQFIPAGSSL